MNMAAFSQNVSVPLRGLWFLSHKHGLYRITVVEEVSVPLRGLWFLSTTGLTSKTFRNKFPSPCGDYGSYHEQWLVWCDLNAESVSVPLRGLWFLSVTTAFKGYKVSMFPSPCGDYGSYRLKVTRSCYMQ